LQVYYSALIFAPKNSLIRERFSRQMPRWLRRVSHIQEEWSPCKQILEYYRALANTVVFSPDNQRVVSASNDKIVRLWDIITAEYERMLEGYYSVVYDVALSPNG
jgi:WD40 repeat protein